MYPAFLSPLSKVPAANFSARLSLAWISYIRYRNAENRTVLALHAKHGPIVLLGPNELSINSYEGGLKTVYGGGFIKTDFYPLQFQFYGVPNMFSTVPSEPHSVRKRMTSHTYSKSALLTSQSLRSTTRHILSDRFLPLLSRHATSGAPIEFLRVAHAYAMDSFTAFQFGVPRASRWLLDEGERDWYLKNWLAIRPYQWWVTEAPGLMNLLKRWLGINVIPEAVFKGLEDLEAWNLAKCDGAARALSSTPEAATGRKDGQEDEKEGVQLGEEPGDKPTIFEALFTHFKKAYGADCYALPVSNKESGGGDDTSARGRCVLEIASDMFDHNAAAMETSGLTLTWLLYELSLRPALQKQLRDELLTLDPPLHYHDQPPMDLPDPKHLDALPLLDAVIQETLRLWPAITGRQPRVTPADAAGVELAGHAGLPPGVTVQAYAFVLHRHPGVFPEPEKWRPERWMKTEGADGEEKERRLAEMRRWFWAFGSGGRACIGRHFAWNAMKHAVASIYTNFTTEIVDAEGIEMTDGWVASPRGEKLVLRFRRV